MVLIVAVFCSPSLVFIMSICPFIIRELVVAVMYGQTATVQLILGFYATRPRQYYALIHTLPPNFLAAILRLFGPYLGLCVRYLLVAPSNTHFLDFLRYLKSRSLAILAGYEIRALTTAMGR